MRTPSVLVSRSIAVGHGALGLRAGERGDARSPGGRASSARARSRRRARRPRSRPRRRPARAPGRMSSRLASISETAPLRRLAADDHADDVRAARRDRACRRRSRRPRASCAAAGRTSPASAATSAAPVGVTSSLSISTPCSGAPRSSSSVAGAGSGSRPCAASTKPRPTGSGEHTTRSMPSDSSASATPSTSPTASTAPTSWKCTRSGSTPWILPSACASRRNVSCARSRGRSARPGGVDLVADRRPVAVRRLAGPVTITCVAPIPCRSVRETSSARPVDRQLDARARVEQRAEQHVARDAADAVDVEHPGHSPRDPRRDRARAEAVVDVHDRDARRARREHREQRGDAAEGRAVAGARRHADHRRGDDPADHRGERRVPARDDDDAVRAPQVLERRREPVDPRHAGVAVHDDLGAEQLRPHLRLAHDRAVRRPAGHDRHEPAHLGHVARHPGEPRPLVLRARPARPRAAPPARPRRRGSPSRCRRRSSSSAEAIARDLLRRLALGHDPLGRALARLAVGVHAREAEIEERMLHGDGGYPRGRYGWLDRNMAARHGVNTGEPPGARTSAHRTIHVRRPPRTGPGHDAPPSPPPANSPTAATTASTSGSSGTRRPTA